MESSKPHPYERLSVLHPDRLANDGEEGLSLLEAHYEKLIEGLHSNAREHFVHDLIAFLEVRVPQLFSEIRWLQAEYQILDELILPEHRKAMIKKKVWVRKKQKLKREKST